MPENPYPSNPVHQQLVWCSNRSMFIFSVARPLIRDLRGCLANFAVKSSAFPPSQARYNGRHVRRTTLEPTLQSLLRNLFFGQARWQSIFKSQPRERRTVLAQRLGAGKSRKNDPSPPGVVCHRSIAFWKLECAMYPQPRSGVRVQPTAQAVGGKREAVKLRRSERVAMTRTPEGRPSSHALRSAS